MKDQIQATNSPPRIPRRLCNNLACSGEMQGTGGSTAMANSFLQYRQAAGAAAREMLIQRRSRGLGRQTPRS